MRIPLILSFGFHFAAFLFAIFGLPSPSPSIVMEHRVIDVEVVSVTETPTPQPNPEPAPPPPPKKSKAPPPPPPEPKPAPPQQAALPPEPEPEPEPAPAPPPEPKVKPVEAPPPPPKPKVEKKPKPSPPKVAPRPKARPKPDFASMMLKTVEKLKETPPPKPKEKKQKKSFEQKMAALMKRKSLSTPERAQQAPLGQNLTISEIDAIKRQVERCWLVPAAIGAKDVEDMLVQIRLKLNPDGTLRESRIVDRFRLETNATYKAVAESALRAIRNPRCNRFTLPVQKYDVWKDMVLRFNPGEMVGR